jgi:hypothetical protein
MDRWHAQHGGFRGEASAAADVYRARTVVWNAFYELELSTTDNRDLCQQARRAIDRMESIKSPDSQAGMDQRADQVHGDLMEMITMARLGEPGRSPLTEVFRPSTMKARTCTVSLGKPLALQRRNLGIG